MNTTALEKRIRNDAVRGIYWRNTEDTIIQLADVFKVSKTEVRRLIAASPMLPIGISADTGTIVKSVPDVQRSFRYTMNDGLEDRAHDVVVAAGVDLTHFKTNPVALYGHNPDRVVGTWSGVHVAGSALKGTLNLAPTFWGERAREEISSGALKACSIGFSPVEFEPMQRGKGLRFTRVELYECSCCAIGMSRGALRERSLIRAERKAELLADLEKVKAKTREHEKAERDRKLDEKLARRYENTTFEQRRRQDRLHLEMIKLTAPK
jgi:HK97 family phage prohead protease